jgi:hypothetical protein
METNDESDACRHFVWAALLTNEFGSDFAQQILAAHEQEPTQPPEEKAMDLANNQRGVTFIKDAPKGQRPSGDNILNEFQAQLAKGKIVVLKPRKAKEKAP